MFVDKPTRQWPGPENRESRLINPLREPEKYKKFLQEEYQKYPQQREVIEKLLKSLDAEQRKHFDSAAQVIHLKQSQAFENAEQKFYADLNKKWDEMAKTAGAASHNDLYKKSLSDPKLAAVLRETFASTRAVQLQAESDARRKAFTELVVAFEKYNDPVVWEFERNRASK